MKKIILIIPLIIISSCTLQKTNFEKCIGEGITFYNLKETESIILCDYQERFWIWLDRIISAENLLTQVFEWKMDTINWVEEADWKLTYNELLFLKQIFKKEPGKFDSINLVANLKWWYNILDDEKSRILYIEIMNNLLKKVKSEDSKIIIDSFLNSLDIK